MREQDLLLIPFPGYALGPGRRQHNLQRAGVYIFLRTDQYSNKTDSSHHCKEKDLEICAIKLQNEAFHFIVKGKLIPLQAWTGPEGSRRLRLPDFKTIGT